MLPGIERFLDEEGKLKQLPSKKAVRDITYAYLAEKFEFDRDYSEHEVNGTEVCRHSHQQRLEQVLLSAQPEIWRRPAQGARE